MWAVKLSPSVLNWRCQLMQVDLCTVAIKRWLFCCKWWFTVSGCLVLHFFLCLQLTSGFAEIFGTELVKNHPYTFPSGSKVAVFSWQGCDINISFDYLLCIFTVLLVLFLILQCLMWNCKLSWNSLKNCIQKIFQGLYIQESFFQGS